MTQQAQAIMEADQAARTAVIAAQGQLNAAELSRRKAEIEAQQQNIRAEAAANEIRVKVCHSDSVHIDIIMSLFSNAWISFSSLPNPSSLSRSALLLLFNRTNTH